MSPMTPVSGSLVRFTPNPTVVDTAEASGDYSEVLTTMDTLHWLMLSPSSGSESASSGTFEWTANRSDADANARAFYRSSEGIDIRNGRVYFVTKGSKSLYILDLDAGTYVRSSTQSGAFDGQPDQVARILAEDESKDMLDFCEEAGDDEGGTIRVCFTFIVRSHLCLTMHMKIPVQARDANGNFYTIFEGTGYNSETSGLAFSPDNRHMYVSYQG